MLRTPLALIAWLTATAAPAQLPQDASALADAIHLPPITRLDSLPAVTPGDERVTLPVHVGAHGPFPFIVDTGSQRTILSSELARSLALAPGGTVRIISMTGPAEVSTVEVPELRYGRDRVTALQAPVLDGANLGGSGLLGLDSLRDKRLVMDFHRKRMDIRDSAVPTEAADPDTIIVRARRKSGQLILVDSQIDRRKVNVVLDTGAEISIGNLALRDRLGRSQRIGKPVPVTLTSVTGETMTVDYMMIRELSVGGVTLRNVGLVFADAQPFAELGLAHKPAMLLGMQMLRLFRTVAIDFGRRRVDFVLPDATRASDARLASR
jgi:predicted aspartyl protease